MRVAIVHDWLVTNAGAEKVLKNILTIYPQADIFSLVDFLNPQERKEILNSQFTTTSFIQKLPFAKKYFRNYLPFFPMAIESFNLKEYDLIISSSWAVAKGIKKEKSQLHISYCHTPIRYAWDLYNEYTSSLKQPKKFIVEQTLRYIRQWDIKTLKGVDYFIANSHFVKERIQRTYKRDAVVIYPPLNIEKFTLNEKKEDFYMTASRLVGYKKTKLIVESFNQMPEKQLIVIGIGEEYDAIAATAKKNVQLLGFRDDTVMVSYMQRAKAFVYAAIEDFGIVPIEALSCGTPVIALNDGGTQETIIDGVNGVHFQHQTVADIMKAVKKFESLHFDAKKISYQAEKYSQERFQNEFKEFVEKATLKYNNTHENKSI